MDEEARCVSSLLETMGGRCCARDESASERSLSCVVSGNGQASGDSTDRKCGPSRHPSGAAAFLTLSLLGVLSVIPDSGSYYGLRQEQEWMTYPQAGSAAKEAEKAAVGGRSALWPLSDEVVSVRPACAACAEDAAGGMDTGDGNRTTGFTVSPKGGFIERGSLRHSWVPQEEKITVEGGVPAARCVTDKALVRATQNAQPAEDGVWGMVLDELFSASETDIEVIVPDFESSESGDHSAGTHEKSCGRLEVECTFRLLVDACELQAQGEEWVKELRDKLSNPEVKTIYLEDPAMAADRNRRLHRGRLAFAAGNRWRNVVATAQNVWRESAANSTWNGYCKVYGRERHRTFLGGKDGSMGDYC
ncbi:hypothetical protein CBR_g55824 [Chara braunii]|uniref:Uncharacterized protein n=1 Tax=Chara braunii TaxID=69332 RepID=A0A388MDF1_CHABU|nr:hypothetical protein CBR_g55824 [Chara braunii]|eukprot:GBG92525.1 hypothetical protein CBR_g55824 [Chara braunii]